MSGLAGELASETGDVKVMEEQVEMIKAYRGQWSHIHIKGQLKAQSGEVARIKTVAKRAARLGREAA